MPPAGNPFSVFHIRNSRRCRRLVDKKSLEQAVRSFMYKHPVRGHDMRHAIAIMIVVAMVLGLPIAASIIPAHSVKAALVPKIVDGTVRDPLGTLANGALVTVRMMNGATVTGTQTYTTAADGFYTVTFNLGEWDPGYTISVFAELGPNTGSNSTIADDEPFQTVNVTLGAVIPEFSSLTVVSGSFIVVALAVVLVSRRRVGR